MKGNKGIAASLLACTLAVILLSGRAYAAPEDAKEAANPVSDAEEAAYPEDAAEETAYPEDTESQGEAELQGLFWKSSPHLSVSLDGWELGQAPNQPSVTGNEENAPVFFIYRDTAGNVIPDIAAAPAGTYTVTAFLEETEDCTAASARAEFEILPTFTVIWRNADGSILETDEAVSPGAAPNYDGPEPGKAPTAQYSYAFRGWEPALSGDSAVTGDITYTAVYAETVNRYTVDFLDDDGKLLRHAVYDYGTKAADILRPAAPVKGMTAEYAFTFLRWTPDIADVTGDAAYTAVYQQTPVQIYHPSRDASADAKPFYSVLAEDGAGGSVRVLPAEARPGTPVLLTPCPDSGFVLDVLIVRGLGRTETLALSRNGDKYTFVMPSFDVSVTSSFRKLDPSDGGSGGAPDSADDGETPASDTGTGVSGTGTPAADIGTGVSGTGTPAADTGTGGTGNGADTGNSAGPAAAPQNTDDFWDNVDPSDVVQYSLVRTGFSDVPGSAYYARAVRWAAQEGVLPGVTERAFAPDSPCTRAQMVLALWRASGSPKPARGYGNPFSDVDVNSPYYEAVLWAMEQGVTRGTTASTFSPDRPVTRAQAVTLLYRLRGSRASRSNPFSDASDGQYFYEAALWACAAGITRGTTASTFSPHAVCTRAQAASFLYRTFESA